MTTDRDPRTRIVLSWLREDAHENAERVLLHTLDEVDTTPQRRSPWPAWRIDHVNNMTKLLFAAAAVLVVAVVGYNLIPGGGVGAKPSPTPAVTAAPATPAPTEPAFPPDGSLEVGRHALTMDGVRLTFAVPAGWNSNGGFGIFNASSVVEDPDVAPGPDGATFIVWAESAADGIFSDPCKGTKAPTVGPSAADLAAAIAAVPGTELVSGPTATTVGGKPAQQVVIRIPDQIGCPPEQFNLWYDDAAPTARYASATGSTIRVWIIDVNGTRLQLDGETFAGAGPGPGNEIQGIIDSIQFE